MKATTRSADIGEAWRPAAASRGATCRGMEHWAALSTNNSLHVSLRRDTWSVICRSGKKGMFLAHSTALKSKRAASSQMFSMPMILLGCIHWLPYRDVGIGTGFGGAEFWVPFSPAVPGVDGGPGWLGVCGVCGAADAVCCCSLAGCAAGFGPLGGPPATSSCGSLQTLTTIAISRPRKVL
ncbi:hypothetical protein EYF80_052435 [Liparis tanakae]|uniref:Uncharacterized protein n=1 Tax=Liparis tanakae TaxID=230148 RepID=A0A4Z2F946_9TELE|nr:hypothetical protein EYF80_052435 [Liparis tanakae]